MIIGKVASQPVNCEHFEIQNYIKANKCWTIIYYLPLWYIHHLFRRFQSPWKAQNLLLYTPVFHWRECCVPPDPVDRSKSKSITEDEIWGPPGPYSIVIRSVRLSELLHIFTHLHRSQLHCTLCYQLEWLDLHSKFVLLNSSLLLLSLYSLVRYSSHFAL